MDSQSGFTLKLQHVQKAWQSSAHHWESTNRLHGNSSLASAHTCHTASPPRMPLGWYPPDPFASFRKHTSGSFDEPLDPGRFSTNTHTCTHSDRTNETWKPKIAACYAFGIFFVFLNLYSNRQAEHIPRRNCIRSDSLGSRRSPFFKIMLYIFINVFTKDKCKDVRSCQDWGASAKYWTRRRWLQQ